MHRAVKVDAVSPYSTLILDLPHMQTQSQYRVAHSLHGISTETASKTLRLHFERNKRKRKPAKNARVRSSFLFNPCRQTHPSEHRFWQANYTSSSESSSSNWRASSSARAARRGFLTCGDSTTSTSSASSPLPSLLSEELQRASLP